MEENTRPATDQEREVLGYLNELRLSGITNMFGAAPFIEADFGLTLQESRRLLKLWMENFNEEGNYENLLKS